MADQPPFYTLREKVIQERVLIFVVMNSEDSELNTRVITGMSSEN
jgi:hypothetical protein